MLGLMKNIINIALLVGGIVLIIFGISASDSLGSDFSRFFTGSPTDETIWMLIGGIVMLVIGSGGLMLRSKSR
jgi:LPXTG-motif cell wall-anchored protein